MAIINILSPHLADMIAAGEVVERPASVLKELIENSFDAGAMNVTVEIRDGGMSYIRVVDDGCGMSPEDAGIAFIRHATSKLHDEAGLDSIATMGFRGEALAAISAVSNMEIITREKGTNEGVRLTLSAGDIDDMVPFGCPEGTTVIVRNLFYNTPARQKFMKSDRAETSACIAASLKCALGRPDVSVRLLKDGEEAFFSPGDGKLDSCLYSLLGREEASGMLSCRATNENLSLDGFISSPAEGRGNRAHQYFFVNGRHIKSQLIQSALEQAYRDTLLVGKYPACVLYLTLPYAAVDVNVHPAKTEVRFANEKQIFDFICTTCKAALNAEDRLAPKAETIPETKSQTFVRPEPPHTVPEYHAPEFHTEVHYEQPSIFSLRQDAQTPEFSPKTAYSAPVKVENVEKPVQNVETQVGVHYNIIGEAFKTYIIVEHNGEIILIDKHAAHERLNFDRLCAQKNAICSQMLLTQSTIRLSDAECEILEKNGELLSELGFEIEPYGENSYIVRSVPVDLDTAQVVPAIEEILDKLSSGKTIDPEERRREVLHTVACKAAIKAGWDTDALELQKLVDEVISGRIKYCPHGRPISATVTRKDLDKLFKRIV